MDKTDEKNRKEAKDKTNTNILKRAVQKIRSHRLLFYSTITLAVLIFSFFATNSYLYVKFLLGNDIVLKLSSDKEDLILIRGQEENISFKASITTNPFCEATCVSKFEDISEGVTLKKESFILKTSGPIQLKYALKITDFGEGQKIFRETINCQAKSTAFCHTSGEAISRNILITAEYRLSDEEKTLKVKLKNDIENLKNVLEDEFSKINSINAIIKNLEDKIIIDDLKNNTENELNSLQKHGEDLSDLNQMWAKQNFYLLDGEVLKLTNAVNYSSESVSKLYDDAVNVSDRYAEVIYKLNNTSNLLQELDKKPNEDMLVAIQLNNSINYFNLILSVFEDKDTFENKQNYVDSINSAALNLSLLINQTNNLEALKKTLDADIEYELLCRLNQTCIKRDGVNKVLNQTYFDIEKSCSDISYVNQLHHLLITNNLDNNQTDSNFSVENVTNALNNLRALIIGEYIQNLTLKQANTDLINYLLKKKNLSTTPSTPDGLLIPSMLKELKKQEMVECKFISLNTTPAKLNITASTIPILEKYTLPFNLTELSLSCCTFGKCKECCTSSECLNSKENYPVVFLHGHSFNKAVDADYSLDAFDKIQAALEKEGYLNSGAVSAYNNPNMSFGVWGVSGIPISVKASYYFDIFQESQNYIVIQTKSENIDTYSIRLNDLVKTIKYRTGKDKVIFITHSMGGLVARRYIQIFGADSVDKLIMVGSPNHGIKGKIADYCSIIGEKLECTDLNSESLFINKVNRDRIPETVDVYNIIGEGCDMNGENGDGVVTKDYAKLDYAHNFYINGSCSGLSTLHTEMLNIDKYPQVYDIIRRALKIE